MLLAIESPEQRRAWAETRTKQHGEEIGRIWRRLSQVEQRLGTPAIPGTADDSYAGHSTDYYLAVDSPLHKGVAITGKLFEWDAATGVWVATGKPYTIRTDFWHGYAFAGQPVIGKFGHQPGLMYASGSGFTRLTGVAAGEIPCNGIGTMALETPLPKWWIDLNYPTSLVGLARYGKIEDGKRTEAHWNDLHPRWDLNTKNCEDCP